MPSLSRPFVSSLFVLAFAVGCAAPASPSSQSPSRDTVASAPRTPDPVEAASPAAEAETMAPPPLEPAEESFVPMEAVPLGDEVIGHKGLPCAAPSECPQRAVFDNAVSLYATAKGGKALVRNAKPRPRVVAEIADEGGKGQRAQVICKAQDYSAQVFIEHTDLRPVVKDFTVATPSRTPDDSRVGLSLIPGSAVDVRKTKGDSAQIEFEQWGLEGSGWVPKSAVGRFYVPADTDPRELDTDRRDLRFWKHPVSVRATPGGRAFATSKGPVSVLRLEEPRDGEQLVAVGLNLRSEPYAVGWVSAMEIDGGGAAVGGVLGGVPGAVAGPAKSSMVGVPAEAELHAPSGAKVGIVRHETRLECLSDCDTASPVVRIECVTSFPVRVVQVASEG